MAVSSVMPEKTQSADGFGFWDESYENNSEGVDIWAAKADDNSGIEPPMKKLKRDPDGEGQSGNNQMESLVASTDGKVNNSSQGGSKRRACSAKTDKTCYRCHKQGHFAQDCKSKLNSNIQDKECYRCHQMGHIARYCPNGDGKNGGQTLLGSQPNSQPVFMGAQTSYQQPTGMSVQPRFQQPTHLSGQPSLRQPVMMVMPGPYQTAMSVSRMKVEGTCLD